MSVYYNEFDPKAAAWLRELISAGLIPAGEVDQRSICDVHPVDLDGFTQCHFFCGVAGWSQALQLARWPADRPVWTGSCPCQPFSCAGKGLGTADERHLWPVFFNLIRERRPVAVFGEQVANAISKGWLDGISADLESAGYACGATVLGAHSVGAPHIRQRLYWVANASCGSDDAGLSRPNERGLSPTNGKDNWGGLAHIRQRLYWVAQSQGNQHDRREPNGNAAGGDGFANSGEISGGLAYSQQPGLEGHTRHEHDWNEPGRDGAHADGPVAQGGPAFWSAFDLIPCRDGKTRRIPKLESIFQHVVNEFPGGMDALRDSCGGQNEEEKDEIMKAIESFPLAGKVPGRAMLLKGSGNAIVPQVAAEFIRAVNEVSV